MKYQVTRHMYTRYYLNLLERDQSNQLSVNTQFFDLQCSIASEIQGLLQSIEIRSK